MGDVYNAMLRARHERPGAASLAISDEAPAGILDVLGSPPVEADQPRRPGLRHDLSSDVMEQYRAIRFQVLTQARERRVQTHLVVSAAAGEGRTFSAVNLARAFSEMRNGRALLIEADLRNPAFHRMFDRPMKPGLAQFLRGEIADIDEAIHRTAHPGLHVIPAGVRSARRSASLLAGPRMQLVLDRGKDLYDHVIIDSPPLTAGTDACVLAGICDQALLVFRLDYSSRRSVDRTRRLLRDRHCEIAGVILTDARGDA